MAKKTVVKEHDNDGVARAVIYARYSCSSQNEQSIEGQLKDCYAYAERCGYLVVGEYIDRALTGRSDDRPDFQRMIDDSRKGQFERVIVWKLDRFSRNRYDSAMYKNKLKQNGVLVCSAMENIGEGDESIILEAVLESVAEYYSRDLSKKVMRGMRDSALKGSSTGSPPPYGYKLVGGKPEVDGERGEFVKWAYAEYVAGTRDKDIYAVLLRRGLQMCNGRKVASTIIARILTNPKYKGVGAWNGIPVDWPALVDAETWDAAQVRRAKNKRSPAAAKAKVHYHLCGKAFCGYCAEPMIGDGGKGKQGDIYRYYVCRGRKKQHACNKKHERKDFLEWYIVEQTLLYVLAPDRVKYIAETVVKMYDDEFNTAAVDALERRIAAIDRELDKTTDLLFKAPSDAAIDRINKHIVELEAQRDELTVEASKQKIANGIRYTVEDIGAWLNQFCEGDAFDPAFRQRIIETFINSIYVYDDKIIIYYNLKGAKQVNIIGNDEVMDNSSTETIKCSDLSALGSPPPAVGQ